MARKPKVKDHAQLEALRDIVVEYIRASARSPILAHSLAMLPYRVIGALDYGMAGKEWLGDQATRRIDDWILGTIDGTAIKYSQYGLGISTPFFSVGAGARETYPGRRPGEKFPEVPFAGIGELVAALKALKGG